MASTNTPASITVEVFRGDTSLARVSFTEPSVTIGSGGAAMLPVSGEGVAELHAVLNVEGGSVTVLDLGAEGGIRVGGEKVANAELASGSRFAIGDLEIAVTVDAPAAADVAASTAATVSEDADPATDPGSAAPSHDDHGPFEDSVAFMMRTNQGTKFKDRAPLLEVTQIWGQLLVETRQYARESHEIKLGESSGFKWHFLGVDMGWVSGPVRHVLPYALPLWSDIVAERKNDFYVPYGSLPNEAEYTLFRSDKEGYVAHVPKGWDGFADIGEKRYTFAELAADGKATAEGEGWKIPVIDGMRLMVDNDGIVFFAHLAHPVRRLVARTTSDNDGAFNGMVGFGTFLFLMFALLMTYIGPTLENDTVELSDRMVELLLEKPPEEKTKKPEANPDAGEGAKAKKEEGKVGKKEAKIDKAKGNKVELKKLEIDRKVAENAGVLGAMNDSSMDQIFGASGLSQDLKGGIGGLIGANGTQFGSGGLGARGGGLGGGGTAEGLGGLGTKGIGSGASGYGSGGGNFGAKGEGGIGGVGGDPIIVGSLDRSLIDEVVKRHMNQIRYCYQRELTKNPALGGKIVIKFTIAKDGTVSSASAKTTTMNNSAVETCIVGRFLRMQFPEPKGGGIVIVSYPFIFSPG